LTLCVEPKHYDGIIRRVDDLFWKRTAHRMATGAGVPSDPYQKTSRAQEVGLTKQAVLEDGTLVMPYTGWDYNPSDRLAGIDKAIADKSKKQALYCWFTAMLAY